MNEHLISVFRRFEVLARGGKFMRWMHRPVGYPAAMLHTYFAFPLIKRKWNRTCKTFWGDRMVLPLPAGLDIFLTGGKGHDSELRLAGWLIRHLSDHDLVLDIGAHLGYYSLLSLAAMGGTGQVFAFEPGEEVREYLAQNVSRSPGIRIFPCAVSNMDKKVLYQSFSIEKSESNRLGEIGENEALTESSSARASFVEAVSLDSWHKQHPCSPSFIKIDAEGSELDVLLGARNLLETCGPLVSMEFHALPSVRSIYMEAARFMTGLGYTANEILPDGMVKPIQDIRVWADQLSIDSDNIIFSPPSG